MILPYFDYADTVYDRANQADLDKLQRTQNRCLKTCFVTVRTDTDNIHTTVKTAELEFRRKVHLRNFMYSKLNDDSLMDNTSQLRDWSLITGRGGGATKWENRRSERFCVPPKTA